MEEVEEEEGAGGWGVVTIFLDVTQLKIEQIIGGERKRKKKTRTTYD